MFCSLENAPKFADWIRNRGGVAHWQSADLGDPGASWSTPALGTDGKPTPKPTWQAENAPAFVVTDPAEITVETRKEVERFRIAIKRGCGFSLVLTDNSSRKLKERLAKRGDGASYHWDGWDGRECVITMPDKQITLRQWMDDDCANKDRLEAMGSLAGA